MQAPFPYWVTPRRRHQLAGAMSSVGIPLASSMLDYPWWRQPDKQDQFPGSVPYAHIATVGKQLTSTKATLKIKTIRTPCSTKTLYSKPLSDISELFSQNSSCTWYNLPYSCINPLKYIKSNYPHSMVLPIITTSELNAVIESLENKEIQTYTIYQPL